MTIRNEQLPKLQKRVTFKPESVDLANRTVELRFSTEAPVQRGFWSPFMEVLSMTPEAVDLKRMKSGAPLLNTHKQSDLDFVLGVVDDAWLEDEMLVGRVRFPKAEDDEKADKIFRKVIDGIIRNASIGYVVNEYEERAAPEGEIPTWVATSWEAVEISLVPVGADPDAGTRALEEKSNQTFPVRIKNLNQEASMSKPAEPVQTPAAPVAPTVDAAAERKAGAEAERTRVLAIRECVRKAGLEESLAEQYITDAVEINQVRELVIQKWSEKGAKPALPANPEVTITRDAKDTSREAMEDALEHRAGQHRENGRVKPLSEKGRRFGHLTLREMARESLRLQGVDVAGMGPMDIASRALHTTSDFPLVLSNVINRTLRRAYEEGISTYESIVREVEVPDFKPIGRYQMGDAPQLEKVLENGEIQRGTMGDSAETYKVETYAKILGVTRQVILNDDMDAIGRIPASFGAAAKSLIADLVWAILNANPTMADGFALFSAQHGNLVTGTAGIAAGLPSMRQALKKQKGPAGRYLNLQAAQLIIGTERETEAEGVVSPLILPQQASNVNTFARNLSVVSDPRLLADPFYLAAAIEQIDIIELAFLEGQRGLYTEQRVGFEVDGLEIKARLDVGAKAIDWRGIVKNPGVNP